MLEMCERIPSMFMMVGLPGSGKSFLAEHIYTDIGKPIIHSSDEIRKTLFNNENEQGKNVVLFQELHKRIKNDLRNGKDVVYDATNINKKRRAAFIRELKNIPCTKICMLVMTPYEQCIENNLKRERNVPEDVIYRMLKNWCPPHLSEGFDKIDILFNGEIDKDIYSINTLFEGDCGIDNFNQENIHHKLTLGEHCRKAATYITRERNSSIPLIFATLLHDVGKIRTKSKLNIKGEDDGNCHYYHHHCVGAYESMFYANSFGFSKQQILYISNLIYYHMEPYLSWFHDEKARIRAMRDLGKDMFNDVMILHKADKFAH